MRIFIVVAKNRPDLYDYFVEGLAGVETVEVILDRRFGGDNTVPGSLESGSIDRRTGSDVYDEMQRRGFVIVRVQG